VTSGSLRFTAREVCNEGATQVVLQGADSIGSPPQVPTRGVGIPAIGVTGSSI